MGMNGTAQLWQPETRQANRARLGHAKPVAEDPPPSLSNRKLKFTSALLNGVAFKLEVNSAGVWDSAGGLAHGGARMRSHSAVAMPMFHMYTCALACGADARAFGNVSASACR